MTMNKKLLLLTMISVGLLSSKISFSQTENKPRPITRSKSVINDKELETTDILIDGSTSREELIETCKFLETEKVMLTFKGLEIAKCGRKQRIKSADGKISLLNGLTESFTASDCFKYIKIEYSTNLKTKDAKINMVEIVR